MRSIGPFGPTPRPSEDAGNSDGDIRNDEQWLHVTGQFQECERGGLSRGNTAETERDTQIPEKRAGHRPVLGTQRRAAKAPKDPECNPESGVRGPTIDKGRLGEGSDPTVREPLTGRHKSRAMQLDGSNECKNAADHEPPEPRGEQEEHRPASSRIGGSDFSVGGGRRHREN